MTLAAGILENTCLISTKIIDTFPETAFQISSRSIY